MNKCGSNLLLWGLPFPTVPGKPLVLLRQQGDEWEEKWGEHYAAGGEANKYADKWGKDGPNVWHERWGEDYDGRGGCTKYTDKVCVHVSHRDGPMTSVVPGLWSKLREPGVQRPRPKPTRRPDISTGTKSLTEECSG